MARIPPGSTLCNLLGIVDNTQQEFYERNQQIGRNNILVGKKGEDLFLEKLIRYDRNFKILSSNKDGEMGHSFDVKLKYKNGKEINVQVKTTEFPVQEDSTSKRKVVKIRLYRSTENGSNKWKTVKRYSNVDFFVFICLNPQKIWIVPAEEAPRNVNISVYSREHKYLKYDFNFNLLKAFSFGVN